VSSRNSRTLIARNVCWRAVALRLPARQQAEAVVLRRASISSRKESRHARSRNSNATDASSVHTEARPGVLVRDGEREAMQRWPLDKQRTASYCDKPQGWQALRIGAATARAPGTGSPATQRLALVTRIRNPGQCSSQRVRKRGAAFEQVFAVVQHERTIAWTRGTRPGSAVSGYARVLLRRPASAPPTGVTG
jgi:hypothetical protein